MSTDLAVQDHQPIATVSDALSVDELVGQVRLIQQAMSAAMKDGEHFGVIPGTDKPTLLKPGAEKLCLLFRLDPEYESNERWEGEHYTVTAICRLFHIPTGNRVASGQGLCSTRESKYAYRNAQAKCPECLAATIFKSKHKPEFYCWKKKGGCGATFGLDDGRITSQETGRVENENLPDTYNTVLKMACKRALVAAVLNGTAASDIFTQDLDDSDESLSGSEAVRPADTNSGATGATSDSESDRAEAVQKVSEAFADVEKNATLPEGWKSWNEYAFDHIKNQFQAKDLGELSVKQLDQVADWLADQKVPI